MKVEVIIAHGQWSVGDIIPEMPENMASWKIQNGVVREVKEAKAMKSPVDRMMKPGVKK